MIIHDHYKFNTVKQLGLVNSKVLAKVKGQPSRLEIHSQPTPPSKGLVHFCELRGLTHFKIWMVYRDLEKNCSSAIEALNLFE